MKNQRIEIQSRAGIKLGLEGPGMNLVLNLSFAWASNFEFRGVYLGLNMALYHTYLQGLWKAHSFLISLCSPCRWLDPRSYHHMLWPGFEPISG